MRVEAIEIYSDTTNSAILRHPGRRFPGVLVQGDTLYSLCRQADEACLKARPAMGADDYEELNDLRNTLWAFLKHYKAVLVEHALPLPFVEIPTR